MTDAKSTDTAARQARIEVIRLQIVAGTYETPKRIEAAVEAFLDSALGEALDENSPGARRRAK